MEASFIDHNVDVLGGLQWRVPDVYAHDALYLQAHRWLLAADSMTVRLAWASGYDVQVNVLHEEYTYPTEQEATYLNIPFHIKAGIREVELRCGDAVWMYARSVFPSAQSSLKGQAFLNLGTRALGSILFNEPDMQRSPFEIALISDELAKSQVTAVYPDHLPLIARRSIFTLPQDVLLLTELFLPPCIVAFNASF